jgi:hypothetical protein
VGIWSWLADKLHFILSYEAGFYKPTPLIGHPPICRITAYPTISKQFLFQAFDPNEWCLKNGHLSGDLNPLPLSHESSALTTGPGLLALSICLFNNLVRKHLPFPATFVHQHDQPFSQLSMNKIHECPLQHFLTLKSIVNNDKYSESRII